MDESKERKRDFGIQSQKESNTQDATRGYQPKKVTNEEQLNPPRGGSNVEPSKSPPKEKED